MTQRKQKIRRGIGILRWIRGMIIALFVMALLAVGASILWQRRPNMTVTTYPMEYQDLIRKYAAENELPAAYVASVILAESSYRADAVSSANAQGLMQILPETGDWIAGKFDETYQEGCLFDPETNIRYGCWYLGFLMRRYDGDMRCASAAYHQGQGTVDKWLANPEFSRDGKTLDKFDSQATETYVNRIMKYYETYEERYAA